MKAILGLLYLGKFEKCYTKIGILHHIISLIRRKSTVARRHGDIASYVCVSGSVSNLSSKVLISIVNQMLCAR